MQVAPMKMFGLMMIAAVAAMSFIGVGTAAADHERVALCRAQELLLCQTNNRITRAELRTGLLLFVTGVGTFAGSLEESCESGMINANSEETETEVDPIFGKFTEFAFTGCKPCKKIVATAAGGYQITMATILGDDWVVSITPTFALSECPFGASCKFGAKSLSLPIEMSASQSTLNTKGAKLTLEEGSKLLCGETATWNFAFALKWKLYNNANHDVLLGEDNVWPTLVNRNADV